ncbi:MAG: IS1096 element passenger TnpR family protein [Anaerolineales bacterium]
MRYQIKITLLGIDPPIWRQLQVKSDTTLRSLHPILQGAMGWMNGHLHLFNVDGVEYSEPLPYDPGHLAELGAQDSTNVKLSDVLRQPGDVMQYDYDFGDGWEHLITLETILPMQPDVELPVIIAGARACPPEDVGGIWGYEEFCEAMADPKHPEHEDYKEWFGGPYDPEAFDLAARNAQLGMSSAGFGGSMFSLHNLFAAQANIMPFTDSHRATLKNLTITPEHPGRILKDFGAMLDVLRGNAHPLTSTHLLPLKLVEQINARLTVPHQHGLKRAQMKSFPHIQGLYLLARASGLTSVDESGSKPKLLLDETFYGQWTGLNPTEQYGHLLESWFIRGWPEIVGDDRYGFWRIPRHLEEVIRFVNKVPEDGLQVQGDKYLEEHLRYIPGPYNLALVDLFGLADVQFITPPEGKPWMIERVQRTPLGDALVGMLSTSIHGGLFDELRFEIMPVDETFGQFQTRLQTFMPAYQTALTPPKIPEREGTHVFKVSLGKSWRRIAINADNPLDFLANAILQAFKFDNDHLYRFEYRNRLGMWEVINHPYMDEPPFTSIVTVGQLPVQVGQGLTYLFDFGDHWEFDVLFESFDPETDTPSPKVIETHGRAPKQYRNW